MVASFIMLAAGMFCVMKGADLLVDGGSSLAKRLGISNLAIGLTVVALGTSMPEMMVNIFSAMNGVTGISVGNIVGSNISNILLILGVSALILPLAVHERIIRRQAPFSLAAALVLMGLFNIEGMLGTKDGIILLFLFVLFFIYVWKNRKDSAEEEVPAKKWSVWLASGVAALGSLMLFFGGRWTIDSVILILGNFDISEILISSTVLAIGTSLPELAASVTAVLKKNQDIAVGNIIGSNIFNILLVLGVTSLLIDIPFLFEWNVDLLFLVFASVLFLGFMWIGKKNTLERWKGAVFVLVYVAYITFLLVRG